MRRCFAAAVAGLLLAAAPAAAAAERRCPFEREFRCSAVTVPIDRSGVVPGKVELAVKRRPGRAPRSDVGVMLFPGGPGAAATYDARAIAAELRPALATRQLVLFDQRGTGESGYLSCDIRYGRGEGFYALRTHEKSVERCAKKLGPRRAFYTTADSAEDVEAVRRSLGLERLALVGVSYGTRLALAYAARYPGRVERIVLDSVVPASGLSPYGLQSVAAMPRVLSALCRGGGCSGVTPDPVGDLTALVDRIRERGAVRPRRALSFFGCRVRPALTRAALFNVLLSGDLATGDRSALPAVLRSARQGDATLYAYVSLFERLDELARCLFEVFELPVSVRDALRLQDDEDRSFSFAANVATYCEEGPHPWPRRTPPAERREAAEAGLAHLPDSAFEPFDRATALWYVASNGCRFWPDSGRSAATEGSLPDVPLLAMAGEEDLRTPVETAVRAASGFRRAKVITVPDYGHSVLGTPCAQRALKRFFAGEPVGECHRAARVFPRPVTILELRCAAKAVTQVAEIFAGRTPRGSRRCRRALDGYLQDLRRDLAERRS